VIGTKLGPYEITGKLGAGGMGEVYRARDTKLERDVAIKVLPAAFTQDQERLARFEREAKLLAQLHHPHIASIFGLEESDGTRALVMELVEGPTLAERLESGPIPLHESLSLARQIAEALEEAHEKGIIHRDLKPQNIKASIEGKVKVLDFGLAKAMDPTGAVSGTPSASQLAQSPTLTLGPTVQGVILGTAAYMAPEQARGLPVDKRADIWAFGVVLHEMLTGRRLFQGQLVTDVLANVLKHDIDLSRLPPETAPPIRRLLRRCLERNPKNRLHDIADARIVIDEVLAEPDLGASERGDGAQVSAAPVRIPWVLAGASLAAALLFAAIWLRAPGPEVRSIHASLLAPEGSTLGDSFAFSPDGDQIAYQVYDAENHQSLWLRELATGEARQLPGTESGELPFWSPDGHHLGFFAEGKLRRLDPLTGGVQVICDAPTPRGGTWGEDGRIVFSPSFRTGLSIVSAGGGEPGILTTLDEARGEKSHRFPVFLPGGRSLLFLSQTAEGGARDDRSTIEVLDLAKGTRTRVVFANSSPLFAANGFLLFWRDGSLLAQRFDSGRAALSGEPVVVASNVGYDTNERAIAAVSQDDALAYQVGGRGVLGTIGRMDRRGIDLGTIRDRERFNDLALSHDGGRLVYEMSREQGATDLWIYDLERETSQRLTFADGNETNPAWSPDDRTIYYDNDLENDGVIYRRAADGSGDAERIGTTPQGIRPFSVAPDGSWLVVEQTSAGTNRDILRYDLATGKLTPLVDSPFNDSEARLSPDGRLLAFTSEQSGRSEVYVQALDGTRGRWQLSSNGGSLPRWRGDGRELFFLAAPDRLMSIAVEPGVETERTPRFAAPVEMFQKVLADFDPAPDGQSFVELLYSGTGNRPLTLVTHWAASLQR